MMMILTMTTMVMMMMMMMMMMINIDLDRGAEACQSNCSSFLLLRSGARSASVLMQTPRAVKATPQEPDQPRLLTDFQPHRANKKNSLRQLT